MSLILTVDDDPQSLFLMRVLLEQGGHTVHEASDGAEAVERASKQRYDLVLMDLQMPGMDGLEAARRIRAEANTPRIVLLTTEAMANTVDVTTSACDDYLIKPIDLQNFCAQINSYLDA